MSRFQIVSTSELLVNVWAYFFFEQGKEAIMKGSDQSSSHKFLVVGYYKRQQETVSTMKNVY